MTNLINELQQMNIYNSQDANPQSNPNDNYEIFERLLIQARDKHLPIKNVKYCKKKHKLNKWMSNEILKFINTKDILYTIMVQASAMNHDVYDTLKTNFNTYKNILRQNIRETKKLYYNNTFLLYKYIYKNLVHY